MLLLIVCNSKQNSQNISQRNSKKYYLHFGSNVTYQTNNIFKEVTISQLANSNKYQRKPEKESQRRYNFSHP